MSFLQTQRQVPNLPINNLISGYDNQINTSVAVISGSRNIVNSLNTKVVGNNNYVFGSGGSNDITGSSNSTTGTNNSITGSLNIVNGTFTTTVGYQNLITSNSSIVFGNSNTVESSIVIPKGNFVSGDSNVVKSDNSYYFGNMNNVDDGLRSGWFLGSNNYVYGGLIKTDYSGLTESGPTSYSPPVMSKADKLWVVGSENLVGTASLDVKVFGSANTLSSDMNNSVVFANNASIDTSNNDQFYIGANYDVNIKGSVLPCNLIQTYTPTGTTDSTYPVGSITKDNEQAYINTDIGWQQLPYRSYGVYYDSTTQTNPTASQINKMKFNTNGDGFNGVYVTNSNDTILFGYTGVYNVQFSAQIGKSGGGDSYIDIWLRKNGADVPFSNTSILISKQQDKAVAAWNWVYAFSTGDTAQICWSSADTTMSLLAIGSQSTPTRPSTPSVILTVWKI